MAERSLFGATWTVRRPVRVQLVVDEWVAFHSEVADGRRTQPREVRCTQRRSVQGGGGSTLVGVDAAFFFFFFFFGGVIRNPDHPSFF